MAGMPRLAERIRSYRAEFGLTDEGGPELLGRIVAAGPRHVLALGQPLAAAAEFWAGIGDLESPSGQADRDHGGAERYPRPRLRTVCVPPRTDLERRVAAIWERFLGIDGIGVDDPFFDLGGNSLVGTAMVRALAAELAVPVPPAALFQHPTVAELAGWLTGTRPTEPGPGPGTVRGERRRRLRVGRDERKRGQAT
jgi:hypothetical protein